jgi:segregation and condensation protein A
LADYRVNLDIFSGPLDLLLYLVRKEEVDIYDIPIAKITDQYIRYIEMLKSLDIDLAGDFLVMAATLMQIKSAMLLPKADPESDLSGEDLADPRTELIRQLLEYKKFKDAANLLGEAADEYHQRFTRPDSIIEMLKRQPDDNGDDTAAPADYEPELDIEQVSIWDLLDAFDKICKATGTVPDISRIKDDTPIDLYQIEILHRLQEEGPMTFERIFESRADRVVLVGLFLALLELIRGKLVWVEQSASAIYLRALTDEPCEQAVQKAILALEGGSDESVPAKRPPIPITELSPEHKPEVRIDQPQQQQTPVPIVEYSTKSKPPVSPEEKIEAENVNHNSLDDDEAL